MSDKIGTAAGLVWKCLKLNGTVTVSEIQRRTKLSPTLTNQALGWLAREGKLQIDRSTRNSMHYSLSEHESNLAHSSHCLRQEASS
jgi:hypothetical protein